MSVEGREGRPRAKWMVTVIAVLAAASVAGWLRLRIDGTLEPLLPENSQARQTVLFLRDSSFASRAVLWLQLRDGGTESDLFAAADAIEKHIDPALVKSVIHPPRAADALDEAMGLLDHAGELLNKDDMAEVEKATKPDELAKRMRQCYLQLTRPEGSFLQQIMRQDPLGISKRILGRLSALTDEMGYRVNVQDGRFVHPDGRQMMLVLEATEPATNLAGSRALVAHLAQLCAVAGPRVQATAICGQIHTEENDRLMRRDMSWAGTIDAIAFVALFMLVCRDWRVTAVFVLPLATVAMTIGLCALFHPSLSTIIIGVAVTMAGSAVDYGIFVYTAVWMGSDPNADVRRIRRPLIISHLTTLGIFVAFMFSDIPAYRQLGWLTSVSLVLSLLAALFVLPRMIRPGAKVLALGRGMPLRRWGAKMVPLTFALALLLGAAVIACRHARFDPDVTRLDGVSQAVIQNENDFQHAWGRSDTEMAILVVSGKTREQAEEANDAVRELISAHLPQGPYASLGDFWPSAAARRANEARWTAFWTPQRIATVRRDMAAAAEPYGFAADAFDPFFASLTSAPGTDAPRQIISSIEQQFVARGGGDWQMLNYFQDTAGNVAAVRAALGGRPDALIVSRRALNQVFAESATAEHRLLVAISVALIVVSLLVLTRSVLKSVLILLPAAAGLVAMLAVLTMMSLPIGVVAVISAILILALASDYGIFAVYAWERDETILGQGMASVHLSTWTTVAGTGALLLAKHPALHIVGVSLTSGLLGGYLTALVAIPGVCYLLDEFRERRAS